MIIQLIFLSLVIPGFCFSCFPTHSCSEMVVIGVLSGEFIIALALELILS